ncbi:hypothetical protein RRG08_037070 [Elysia crispata]|uniref:Uncharacterized protein n=1 Tax=Elysia crispata TaxID=231223 RepID=A0AAE1DN03_9GAST|nr:hypothetical protein RRG08_037070 [Elysia crispata]
MDADKLNSHDLVRDVTIALCLKTYSNSNRRDHLTDTTSRLRLRTAPHDILRLLISFQSHLPMVKSEMTCGAAIGQTTIPACTQLDFGLKAIVAE